ncbi:hypothetical protein HYY73_03350 [Candidatus Woesearchaeota archaeon]|nr:hypothetical protein [Candidatus Woesearchaeota archaeon]
MEAASRTALSTTLPAETGVLSEQEEEKFIGQYYGLLIDDSNERERLTQLARNVASQNRRRFGLPTAERLQQTLGEILDNYRLGREWEPVSLNAPLTDTGFTLEQVLAAPEERTEVELKAAEAKGERLLSIIRQSLPEEKFQFLVDTLGDTGNLASILGSTDLTPEDISDRSMLSQTIGWLGTLPPEARKLYAEFQEYQRLRIAGHGRGLPSPMVALDETSMPIVQRILRVASSAGMPSLEKRLKLLGLRTLLERSHGISGIVKSINPELLHKIPQIPKWKSGQASVQTALNAIQEVLYTQPGYRDAEETSNRAEQVRIITELIEQTPSLTDYFSSRGLNWLMSSFVDVTGKEGIKKEYSPRAVLEFYNKQKGLGWFDRTQLTYVPGWKIRERYKWQRGEESVQLALEAIQDVLRTLPGFRQAEDSGNREEQVRIVNQLILHTALTDFFEKAGLSGLMQRFVDTKGRAGIRKGQSPKAVLEFYSENMGLDWFNRTQPTYVAAWRITEKDIWQRGEKSSQLAVEAIEDALYALPGYREAEQADRREEQLRILNHLLQQKGQQRDYFARRGLDRLTHNNIVLIGRTGPKKLDSVSALLEFYSERKHLDWSNPAYALHLIINRSGSLVVADRRQEWAAGSYGSSKAFKGTGLEAVVEEALSTYGLQQGVEEFCYMFFSKKDALLANSPKERVILAYKLGVFLYMAGVIPRILPNGEARRLGPEISGLAFVGYSHFTHSEGNGREKGTEPAVPDILFSRLMMNIVRHYTRDLEKEKQTGSRDHDPSVEEIINEVGKHPLIAQRYGRPVSYDDVLPALSVMERYMTGQRAVTIRIGSLSMPMKPEAIDDLWVLNPEFIRLRSDNRLYWFLQRVGTVRDWYALIDRAGQRKKVVEYAGTEVTHETVKSNPKAKFIKNGALPSRELVRLGY